MTRSLMFLIMGLLLAGCESKVEWKEEVKLSTGETITVEREVKHKGGGAAWPQGQGSIPMEHIIRFKYPPQTGAIIEWRSTKLEPQGTYAELPLVLDMGSENTWSIFTRHWTTGACIEYVEYKFRNGVWKEMPPAENIEIHATNLFLAAGGNDIEGLVSLAEKAEENSDPRYPKHLKKVGPKRVICRPGENF